MSNLINVIFNDDLLDSLLCKYSEFEELLDIIIEIEEKLDQQDEYKFKDCLSKSKALFMNEFEVEIK